MDDTPPSFLTLPLEIRFQIYGYLFHGHSTVTLTPTNAELSTALIPSSHHLLHLQPKRTAQLLRTCKTVLFEAQPILYANTTFHTVSRVFAGKLPDIKALAGTPDGNAQHKGVEAAEREEAVNGQQSESIAFTQVRHVIYQVDCDMLMVPPSLSAFWDRSAFVESANSTSLPILTRLETLEIRVRVENWRGSFLGERCDREVFVGGREGVLKWAKELGGLMGSGTDVDEVQVVEDKGQLGRGCVKVKLRRVGRGVGRRRWVLRDSESLVE